MGDALPEYEPHPTENGSKTVTYIVPEAHARERFLFFEKGLEAVGKNATGTAQNPPHTTTSIHSLRVPMVSLHAGRDAYSILVRSQASIQNAAPWRGAG